METNWIIITAVAIVSITLVVYLILQNQKDKEEVTDFFTTDTSEFTDEEEELNNNR